MFFAYYLCTILQLSIQHQHDGCHGIYKARQHLKDKKDLGQLTVALCNVDINKWNTAQCSPTEFETKVAFKAVCSEVIF